MRLSRFWRASYVKPTEWRSSASTWTLELRTPYKRIDKVTASLAIGLLINNAALATSGSFIWHQLQSVDDLLRVNVFAPTRLAHHFGKKKAARGRGGIVFVSSTFGYQAVPYFQSYAASKAYLLAVGEALFHELKPLGVDVSVLSPGPTNTAMKAVLRTLGRQVV